MHNDVRGIRIVETLAQILATGFESSVSSRRPQELRSKPPLHHDRPEADEFPRVASIHVKEWEEKNRR